MDESTGHHLRFAFSDMAEAGSSPGMALSTIGAGDMSADTDQGRVNRLRFLEELGVEPSRLLTLEQTHSRDVYRVESSPGDQDRGSPPKADGVVCRAGGPVLGITVADCLPIFLFDPITGAYGLVHSGWRGTGIVLTAIEEMSVGFGVHPRGLHVLLGPGIRGCCYDVPLGRAHTLRSACGPRAVAERDGRFYADLPTANAALLSNVGVARIDIIDMCTSCTPTLGSFRRQGEGEFSRMLAVIGHF